MTNEVKTKKAIETIKQMKKRYWEITEQINEIEKTLQQLKIEQKVLDEYVKPSIKSELAEGLQKVVRTYTRKKQSKNTIVVKRVLESNPNEWFRASELAEKAIEMEIWKNVPETYQSVMSGTLRRLMGNVDWMLCEKRSHGFVYKWKGENME